MRKETPQDRYKKKNIKRMEESGIKIKFLQDEKIPIGEFKIL